MREDVGKLVRIRDVRSARKTVVVNTVGEGLRRHIHLCSKCKLFTPDKVGHCEIAQKLDEVVAAAGIATAIVRCPTFQPLPGVLVEDCL